MMLYNQFGYSRLNIVNQGKTPYGRRIDDVLTRCILNETKLHSVPLIALLRHFLSYWENCYAIIDSCTHSFKCCKLLMIGVRKACCKDK